MYGKFEGISTNIVGVIFHDPWVKRGKMAHSLQVFWGFWTLGPLVGGLKGLNLIQFDSIEQCKKGPLVV